MSKPVRLVLRGNRWTFRVSVPEDIRQIVGKREIWKSLGVISHQEAVRLSHIESVKVDALFAEARKKLAGRSTNDAGAIPTAVSDAELEQLARSHLHRAELRAERVYDPLFAGIRKMARAPRLQSQGYLWRHH